MPLGKELKVFSKELEERYRDIKLPPVSRVTLTPVAEVKVPKETFSARSLEESAQAFNQSRRTPDFLKFL